MRVAVVDTYYPDALAGIYRKHVGLAHKGYDDQIAVVLRESFGTSDYVSNALGCLGWEARDIIANCTELQSAWAPGMTNEEVAMEQIAGFRPEVVLLQDLSVFSESQMGLLRSGVLGNKLLVAQCSCPWPGDERIALCHVVFTSFPHYVKKIETVGARAEFLRLAFDPRVLQRLDPPVVRDLPVSFVGGFGRHWSQVNDDFRRLAMQIPEFRWWGYGAGFAPGQVQPMYRGEAWGIDMYNVYARSKIVVNRHGEVAEGSGNNLRQYEATGCGAMLLTDQVDSAVFVDGRDVVRYRDGDDLVDKVRHYLSAEAERQTIAESGQGRVLSDHTYKERARAIDSCLKENCNAA